ncbi:DNA-binding protein H-NS [Paraburkholderia sp. WSM4175]|uniref:H-NS histone family protein n=1 Tax=Paraburkholderia sp. WSM4175 TaxID=2991072 RepID=UPI003D1FA0BD
MTTLESLQAKIKKLEQQADALVAKQSSGVIEKIRELMSTHGLTTADIDAHVSGKKRGPKPGAKSAVATKASSAAKYQDQKTGATWSGHGRAPGWIANAKDRTKFLIQDGADAVVAAGAAKVSKAKTGGKKVSPSVGATGGTGQRKGPQPAMYLDPKSGATWSGRGPAPAWLAGAKDRSRFLIDGAGVGAAVTETGKPKAGVKKAASKNVVAPKKAAVTKSPAASKKVAAKKTVAPPTKRTVVKTVAAKKAAGKKAAPVKAVAANADNTAVPEATLELSA